MSDMLLQSKSLSLSDEDLLINSNMQNYASLQDHHEEEQGIFFHVAEPTRSKWNHIEDLDSFFTRMYKYHQKHGFLCMLLEEIFKIHQYMFVVVLTTYLVYGINYTIMFDHDKSQKLTFSQIILPPDQVYQNLSGFACILLFLSIIIWCLKILSRGYQMILFWDIKQFYNCAIEIDDNDLDNVTWSEIVTKIKFAQLEQQMCIHKRELNELDIYHRILRQENYIVALINKKLLPPRFTLPFFGELVYWTKSLKYNVQGLLFWSPWAPFENPWHLREEYKRQNLRHELARQLGKQILWLAALNIIFAPIVLVWQLMLTLFSYGDIVKRDPGRLGLRYWSLYGKYYFRHFNELDHELYARLNRAYRPATKYLGSFNSPLVTVIAQHVAFICGSLFTVFILYTLIDDSLLRVEHLLAVITFLGVALPICRGLIPDESMVWCPEALLQGVVMHTHYLPTNWKEQAHTTMMRDVFQELFQYRVVATLEDLFSAILTPYLLIQWIYPRRLDIVDFLRNFTVSVAGVGDVCSFAQMDIRKHGNPDWQQGFLPVEEMPDQYRQAEDGKVELSLVHFTTTNPTWEVPEDAKEFVKSIKDEIPPYTTQDDLNLFASVANLIDSSLGEYDIPEYDVPPIRSYLDLSLRRSMTGRIPERDGVRKSVWMSEGPDLAGSHNMRSSVLIMHDRFKSRKSVVSESSPLLPTQP